MDVPGSGVTRSRRFADSRSRRARPACPNEIVLAARYALCAGLDEAVLSTPWGAQSEWAQHPLLVALHREAWGGEKFFEMLDRISQDPTRYIDLMELQYLVHCVRLRRQVPGAGARARAARGSPAGPLPQDSQSSRPGRAGAVAALARTGGSAQSAHSVRALVGRRRGGAGDPRDHLHGVLREPRAASPTPVHAELAKVGLEDFSPPPRDRSGARARR